MPSSFRLRMQTLAAFLLLSLVAACGNDDPAPKAAPASASKTAEAAPSDVAVAKPPAPPAAKHPVEDAIPAGAVSRWYDDFYNGQKSGTSHVVWSPSTWQGNKTIRDSTTDTSRTARDMAGHVDVIESHSLTTTERGEDGTLWWQTQTATQAGGRKTTSELTWTGSGYDLVVHQDVRVEKKHIATATPVQLDAESYLGPKIVRGEAKPGSTWTMHYLDFAGERVKDETLEVVGIEPGPSESGDVPCTKIRMIDADTKSESLLWIDAEGAFARFKTVSNEQRRVSPETARKRPSSIATFSITVPQEPPIERIFSADRVLVDVHLRGDPDRPLPEYPTSPFSRATGVEGDDKTGYVVHIEMKAYDAPDAHATIPVTDPAFKKDLEPTIQLCIDQPDIASTAKRVVGDEKDARKAALKLLNFVFTTLAKQPPSAVGLSASEVLRERRGFCSDHCVLFTALCRAAGIPARRCSGFVCVGSIWGAHAWSEIWTGAWMGVDPTTDDVGTAARYIFYGYDDDPNSHPGLVSERVLERIRIEVTHLDEGSDHLDLASPDARTFLDAEKKIASQRLTGLEFRDWPSDWTIDLGDEGQAFVRGPGFSAQIGTRADQGYRGLKYLRMEVPGREIRFGGAPAMSGRRQNDRSVAVSSRRRVVKIDLGISDEAADSDAILATLEKVMKKTFTLKP